MGQAPFNPQFQPVSPNSYSQLSYPTSPTCPHLTFHFQPSLASPFLFPAQLSTGLSLLTAPSLAPLFPHPAQPSPGPSALARTPQLLVQLAELVKEASVGEDPSVLPHGDHCLAQGHLLAQHEVGQDQCGGAAHAYHAVHQDLG